MDDTSNTDPLQLPRRALDTRRDAHSEFSPSPSAPIATPRSNRSRR